MPAHPVPEIQKILLDACRGRRIGRAVVLAPEGELGGVRALRLEREVDRAIGRGDVRIVLDLRRVGSITGSAVATLIRCVAAARIAGGDLRAARMRMTVRHSLALVGGAHWLRPHRTIEGACASFAEEEARDD